MPLIRDDELLKELKFNRKDEIRGGFLGSGVALIISTFFFWIVLPNIGDDRLVVGAIVVSTLCLVGAIMAAGNAICLKLKILICISEWVGRKQLGEYVRPQ